MHVAEQADHNVDWEDLRRSVAFYHTYRPRSGGDFVCRCASCHGVARGFEKGDASDTTRAHMHEALVTRGDVPKKKQWRIFVVENCVPLCHDCHEHTKQLRFKAMATLFKRVGAHRIGHWYVTCWRDGGLALPKGLLKPHALLKTWDAIKYLGYGERIVGAEAALDHHEQTHAALRWLGRSKGKSELSLNNWQALRKRMDDGYYAEYLSGVFGFDIEELIKECEGL